MSSIKLQLIGPDGKQNIITVLSTDTVGKIKKALGQSDARWKHEGDLLENEVCFGDVVEEMDVITSNVNHRGGIKNKKISNIY
jgi:hypothetical protein